MKPLHQILPGLEDAVARHVPDPVVQEMSEGELRTLVYKIVDNYQRKFDEPEKWFEAMAQAAIDQDARLREEKSSARLVRAQILARLLFWAGRSISEIGVPVRVQVNRAGADQQFVLHPLLRGIELASSRKQLMQSDGSRAIVGRTWAVVALAGARTIADARWAIMDHVGSLDEKGFGEERITVSLTDPEQLSDLSDRLVGEMITALAAKLSESDVRKGSAQIVKIRDKLNAARVILSSDLEPLKRVATPL